MTRQIGFGAEAPRSDTRPDVPATDGLRLEPGEVLLWRGVPTKGFLPDWRALMLSAPALIGTTYFAFTHYSAQQRNEAANGAFSHLEIGLLPGMSANLSALVVVAIILVYLFLYNLRFGYFHPAVLDYALTDRRAIVNRKLPWRKITSYPWTHVSRIEVQYGNPGNVFFGEEKLLYTGTRKQRRPGGFRRIDDAELVYTLALQAAGDPK